MKGILLVGLYLISITLFAQTERYDIALSGGIYQAPAYQHTTNKLFLSADFNYHAWNRWTISAGFLNGQYAYFDDYRSNAFSYDDYTNAKGYESHIYVTASYSILHTSRFSIQVGSGFGQFTQRLKFPFYAPSSYGSPGIPAGTLFLAEVSSTAFEIPLKVEVSYQANNWMSVGLKAGAFLPIKRSLLGAYVGPQVHIYL